jgi:5-methylcytosine-specific restriction endonuclease McrA
VQTSKPTQSAALCNPIKQLKRRLFVCPECGKPYKYKAAFKKHKKTHLNFSKALKPADNIIDESARVIDLNRSQHKDRYNNRYRGTDPTLKSLSNISKAHDHIERENKRIKKANASYGRRWGANIYGIVFALLVSRDGAYCALCGALNDLQIEHLDSNIHNHAPENLRLLCRNCNLEIRNVSEAKKRALIDSAINLREREKKLSSPDDIEQSRLNALKIAGKPTDKAEYSTIEANATYERRFRKYVYDTVKAVKSIYKKELILSGAEYCDCSQQSTARYLEKMTSSKGDFVEYKTPAGAVIMFKSDLEGKAASNE